MSRRTLLLVILSFILFYFSALGTMPLLEPDEGRYAEIAREMLARGDYVTPHLNGVVYLEKPPLYYWGTALSMRLLGETEFAARAFTASTAVAGILLTFWMGSALAGWRTGLFSAIALATSVYYYMVGRLNTLDTTLTVALLLAIFPAWLYLSGKRKSRGYLFLSYGAAGAAYLAKGLIGVVFPPAILLAWMALSRRWSDIRRALSLRGLLVFLAIALPWTLLVQARNPEFFNFFIVREHFLRYTTEVHNRNESLWYFLPIIAAGFIPWAAFLPAVVTAVRKAGREFLARESLVFLLCWILFVFLFFSLSGSKLPTYMEPIFPPLAVLLGRGLDLWAESGDARPCRTPLAMGALIAAAALILPPLSSHPVDPAAWMRIAWFSAALALAWGVLPLFLRRLGVERVVLLSFLVLALFFTSLIRPAGVFLGAYKSVKRMGETIAASARPGDIVAQYGIYKQGIPFYAKRRTVLVDFLGEMAFGAERAPDRSAYFIDAAAFDRLWASGSRVFCVFDRKAMPIIEARFPSHRLLYRSDEGILIVNRP